MHWQPESGQGLPEASSSDSLGVETGWYFDNYDNSDCCSPTLTIAPEKGQFVHTLKDVVACLGYASVDVCVQSSHETDVVTYQRNHIDTDELEQILARFRTLLLGDHGMGMVIIDPSSDYVVMLQSRKVIEVVGALREDFTAVCRMHGIPHNPKLQLLDAGGLDGISVGYQQKFDLFIKALAAEALRQEKDEEEDSPHSPL
ncbi:MAG: hypothetical protein AAB728_04105 [Patescibacteria group bacterium]